ncbi:MAG: hypothetical protein PHU08_07675 [Dehalococcoidales bacterium]|nr:hypothetical protein [Dehalococcoidales bacterium]
MQNTPEITPTQPVSAPPVPPREVKKTWMPTTAGVLCIVAGVIDLFVGIAITALSSFIGALSGIWGARAIGTAFGIPIIILGIVAVIGGIYALQRRVWGLALAGAICALLIFPVWPGSIAGLLAIIFVAVSKQEFK